MMLNWLGDRNREAQARAAARAVEAAVAAALADPRHHPADLGGTSTAAALGDAVAAAIHPPA